MEIGRPLILYDGFCPLCNFFLKLCLYFDTHKRFYYSSLQSESSKNLAAHLKTPLPSGSFLLYADHKLYTHHRAVFKALSILGFPANLLLIFRLLPDWMNNKVYVYIAENRYRFFGKYPVCKRPPTKYIDSFLN